MKAITTKGPGDLWHPPEPSADELAFEEFCQRLDADNGAWREEIIRQFLVEQSGPLFEVLGRVDWIYMLNGDHGVWLTDAEVSDICGSVPRHLKAFSADGRVLVRGLRLCHYPHFRYDLMDVVAYQKSADIAAAYGVERDVTAEKKLAEYIIRDSLSEWFQDDDNVRKLMEVC